MGQPPTTAPRLAIFLGALEKSGKTHWALFTPPGPIAVVMADEGTEHVMHKAKAEGKQIAGELDILYRPPVTKGKAKPMKPCRRSGRRSGGISFKAPKRWPRTQPSKQW